MSAHSHAPIRFSIAFLLANTNELLIDYSYPCILMNEDKGEIRVFYQYKYVKRVNGGENSLHWQANMLPLFSIMTLWI